MSTIALMSVPGLPDTASVSLMLDRVRSLHHTCWSCWSCWSSSHIPVLTCCLHNCLRGRKKAARCLIENIPCRKQLVEPLFKGWIDLQQRNVTNKLHHRWLPRHIVFAPLHAGRTSLLMSTWQLLASLYICS